MHTPAKGSHLLEHAGVVVLLLQYTRPGPIVYKTSSVEQYNNNEHKQLELHTIVKTACMFKNNHFSAQQNRVNIA